MSNQITISAATQGTGNASTAQASGKGSGFLGMLMAAIGHKGGADNGMKGPAQDTQGMLSAKAGDASLQDAKAKAMNALIGKMAQAGEGKAKGAQHAGDASLQDAKAKAMNALIGKTTQAGEGKAKGAQHAGDASLQDAKAKAGPMLHVNPSLTLAEADAMKAKATKTVHKQHDGQDEPSQSGKDMSGAMPEIPAAPMLQTTAMAPSQGKKTGHGQAATDAVADAIGGRAKARAVPTHGMNPTRSSGAGIQAGASSAPPTPTTGTADAQDHAMQLAKAAEPENPGSAGMMPAQSADTSAGLQTQGQASLKDGTKVAAKGAGALKAAAQAAKSGKTVLDMGTDSTHAHPQDTVVGNHANSSDAAGQASARTSLPQAGMHSYQQAAGAHARQLPVQATLVAHTAPAPRSDMPATSGPSAGQDATAAAMALGANPGTASGAQGTANPQAMPQSGTHVSGPWTAMAAMHEISQAATNGKTRLEIKLEPAHLGKVHVRIDSDKNKNIQVHLVVEQPNARQAIEQHLPNLRHALEQQGLNLGNFSMSSQQQGGGQDPSGQPGQQAPTTSAPAFSGSTVAVPHISQAPSEPAGTGRLSIRI